ncbi:MAG: hypothetical protein CVU42_01285 [Chloroflexi bacterium HGW-Chloroflexi-4]|jgi:hypothetical protein|nr:MAG: hypothetical protein CVU42_01285 [Chloroflexi bacterium HGW-Chloroflexi-4]
MKVSKKGGGRGVGVGIGVAVSVGVAVFSGVWVSVGVGDTSGVTVEAGISENCLVGVYRCTMFAPELELLSFCSWQPVKTRQATIKIIKGNAKLRWNMLKVNQTSS